MEGERVVEARRGMLKRALRDIVVVVVYSQLVFVMELRL